MAYIYDIHEFVERTGGKCGDDRESQPRKIICNAARSVNRGGELPATMIILNHLEMRMQAGNLTPLCTGIVQ